MKAQTNLYHVFVHRRTVFAKLARIDELFWKTDSWSFPSTRDADILIPDFLRHAHKAYLGGARLGLSGQLVEGYMVMRGCLENALYAARMHVGPRTLARAWLNREDTDETKKRMRQEFAAAKCWRALRQLDPQLEQDVRPLYEHSIAAGAHPNVGGHLTTSGMEHNGTQTVEHFVSPESAMWQLCAQMVAKSGIIALLVFERIYPDLFAQHGLTAKLKELDWRKTK